ncbi:MAG: sporulation protein YunB [Oscillospiraceae bacterium]
MRKGVDLKNFKIKLKFFIVISLLIYGGFLISNNLEPVIQTICANQAKILCTSAVNKAVVAELERLYVDYDGLVTVVKDPVSGQIIAIETNAVEVNKLKAILTDAVNDKLAGITEQSVRIPIGTLTGIEILSGRGPKIRLKMLPSSYVETNLVNKFDTAGINQTHHQIMIEFKVKMTAILAPYSTSVDVSTNVCIAETVIIGAVPNTYATF